MMKISGLCGIGSADWSSFAAMFASDCAHPHPPIVCWRLSHNSDSLSVAKSQLFLPAIARNSSRIARCAGVIPSLARMASIPSLIPRNAPSTATPFPRFHMNRTLDSCLPTVRFLKSIVIFGAQGTSLSHLRQTALGGGMAALSPFIQKNRGLITSIALSARAISPSISAI